MSPRPPGERRRGAILAAGELRPLISGQPTSTHSGFGTRAGHLAALAEPVRVISGFFERTAQELADAARSVPSSCSGTLARALDCDVQVSRSGKKRLRHPELGVLELDHTVLQLADNADQRFVVYSAGADSPEGKALTLL